MPSPNPYAPTSSGVYAPAPFAGRAIEYAGINRHLTDSTSAQAMVVVGRKAIGKSALLWNFFRAFDANTIGVYVPLPEDMQRDEEVLRSIVQHTFIALEQRQLHMQVLATEPDPDVYKSYRVWFTKAFMPSVLNSIRTHRRLILLLDDVHRIPFDKASDSVPQLLSDLIQQSSQLSMIVTLPVESESEVDHLEPFMTVEERMRLDTLSVEGVGTLLNLEDVFDSPPEVVEAANRLTGGHPLLVQWLGYHLFERISPTGRDITNAADIKTAIPDVMHSAAPFLREQWQSLPTDEQYILSGISDLHYNDPLTPITPERIDLWLAEADHPLNPSATRSALRSLEYAGFITHHLERGILLSSEILERWLLGHASSTPTDEAPSNVRGTVLIIGLVAILIAALILIQAITPPRSDDVPQPATATLEEIR